MISPSRNLSFALDLCCSLFHAVAVTGDHGTRIGALEEVDKGLGRFVIAAFFQQHGLLRDRFVIGLRYFPHTAALVPGLHLGERDKSDLCIPGSDKLEGLGDRVTANQF